MSAASSESNVDDCHRHSLTVEPINPMHLIASGKGNRRFSTQAEAECQKRLMKKFSITSEEQKDVYSAAVADKLEDQEVNNLRKKRSQQERNDKKNNI